MNVDDFHEGWVPATYLEPLYGERENSVEVFDPGEGKSLPEAILAKDCIIISLSLLQRNCF